MIEHVELVHVRRGAGLFDIIYLWENVRECVRVTACVLIVGENVWEKLHV